MNNSPKKSTRKPLIAALVVVLILAAGWFIYSAVAQNNYKSNADNAEESTVEATEDLPNN